MLGIVPVANQLTTLYESENQEMPGHYVPGIAKFSQEVFTFIIGPEASYSFFNIICFVLLESLIVACPFSWLSKSSKDITFGTADTP